MRPVRGTFELLSHNPVLKRLVTTVPGTSTVVRSYVAGEGPDDVVKVVRSLRRDGLSVAVDHLGEPTRAESDAVAAVAAYRTLVDRLADAGLARDADLTVRLAALGAGLPGGDAVALDKARKVCRTAARAGVGVTLHPAPDRINAGLRVLAALREDFPDTGIVLEAVRRRTEADCRVLAHAGSRVRLTKGAAEGPAPTLFGDAAEVDRSFVRCLKVLLAGDGYPMLATHDARLIEITAALASRYGRAPETYEIQMPLGVRTEEQRRLADSGEQVRVEVPYGPQWYAHLVRRVAERPGNLRLFVTSLVSRR